jgi:hypothetical protein
MEATSPQKQINIIENMLVEARKSIMVQYSLGSLTLFWVIFFQILANYIATTWPHTIARIIAMVFQTAAIIVLLIVAARQQKLKNKLESLTKTHLNTILNYSAGIMMISILLNFVCLGIGSSFSFDQQKMLPFFLIPMGAFYVQLGGALKFKPITIGGIVMWIGAVAIAQFGYPQLIFAGAFLGGIIPIHILRMKYHEFAQRTTTT